MIRKITSFFIAIVTFLTVGTGADLDDSFEGHDFPLISASEKEEGKTRIMSFNIRCSDVNGVPVRKRASIVALEINKIAPDVFGVQECTGEWITDLGILLPQYACIGVDRDTGRKITGGEHACVFYLRSKFKLLDSGDFWLSDTPDVPSFGPGAACRRVCTWAKLLNRSTGETFVHVNTHFDHVSEEARVLAGNFVNAFIQEHFSGMNVIFTAHLNTTANGEAYKKMTENLFDARLNADNSVPFGTFHGLDPEGKADYVIDFILCSPGIHVSEYRTVTEGINGRFVSDHFPIYADITFPE